MPAKSDTIIYTMRFPQKDKEIYTEALRLAEKRRISLAELIRQLLIREIDMEKIGK